MDFWVVYNLNLKATEGIEPDLTFLLDIEPEVGLARIKRGYDRLERAGLKFHKRVNQGYLEVAKAYPWRFVVIDATKSIKEIQEEIFCATMERLEKAGISKKVDTTGGAAIRGGE